jgi:hypothetical protein
LAKQGNPSPYGGDNGDLYLKIKFNHPDNIRVEAKYGNDDKVRSLTNTLIDTQQAEIQLLQNWLRNHGYAQ